MVPCFSIRIHPQVDNYLFERNVGVFADEIDAKGNAMTKVWELR
jgi:hypothetical protein